MSELSWLRTRHGDVCLQGGHVTRWSGRGGDALFMSRHTRLEPGQAIRGGVPVIFPWFGDDPDGCGRPPHGFVRRLPWRLVETHAADRSTRCVLDIEDDDETRALWAHCFRLQLDVTFGAALTLALTVENRDSAPLRCEMALHTYIKVGDVRRIAIRGLESTEYLDKVNAMRRTREGDTPIVLTGETDRVYLNTVATCEIDDPVLGRRTTVAKDGSRSTILWNPWSEKAARMADLGDEWPRFVCVESGNVGEDAVTVAPGAQYTMTARIS
jgi:glucose-6-phosphate 1-epimerase